MYVKDGGRMRFCCWTMELLCSKFIEFCSSPSSSGCCCHASHNVILYLGGVCFCGNGNSQQMKKYRQRTEVVPQHSSHWMCEFAKSGEQHVPPGNPRSDRHIIMRQQQEEESSEHDTTKLLLKLRPTKSRRRRRRRPLPNKSPH